MLTVKLRAFREVDFRKSELNNYRHVARAYGHLASDEVYLFVSRSGDQLVWILHVDTEIGLLDSRRWRLWKGSRWSPLMLQNYAREVGIRLEGIRTFEEAFSADMRHRLRRVGAV